MTNRKKTEMKSIIVRLLVVSSSLPVTNFRDILWCKIVRISTRHNNVIENWRFLNMLEDDLPAFAAWLLRGFCYKVGIAADSIGSSAEAAVHRAY